MSPLFTVLSSESSAASDQAFCKFAHFLGLQTEMAPLNEDLAECPEVLLKSVPSVRILALGRTALSKVFQRDWFANLLDQTPFLFAYDFDPKDCDLQELKWLTSGALTSVSCLAEGVQKHFTVHADVTHGNLPVSGKSYQLKSGPATVFSKATPDSGVETYISVNGHPHFVSVARGRSLVFLLAGPGLVDIDTSVTWGNDSLRPWYAQLIALSIGLRVAAGPWCWTSPVTAANFIVDDPYLKERYGFINYENLVGTLQKEGGAVTIAFIPYNYRRSDAKTVDLLLRNSSRFSIALHGCDHTDNEFASLNEAWLTSTIGCALDRMDDHARLTGMPFDNIMIFPKCCFSTMALRALKSSGVAASVNSSPWPSDNAGKPLTIRDRLQVAVTHYENFPLFLRRVPGDVFDFAFDALFQKPLLAAEHHGFFRDGYESLTRFISDISNIKTNLVWMPLGQAIASSCLMRQTGEDQFAIQHLTKVLRLPNPTSNDLHLSLEKPESHESVRAVVVDGTEVPFEINSNRLEYKATLAAGAELNVSILYDHEHRAKREPTWKYRLSVTARRMMSDVRDNYLSRNERLLLFAEKIMRRA